MRLDVNRYIVKYDFDVSKRICPLMQGVTYNDEYQDAFRMNAMLELLQ